MAQTVSLRRISLPRRPIQPTTLAQHPGSHIPRQIPVGRPWRHIENFLGAGTNLLAAGALIVIAIAAFVLRGRDAGAKRDQSDAARPPHVSAAAWEAYRRGREQEARRTFEGYLSAIEFYRQAESLDSNFVAATAGLARAYTNFGYLSFPGGPPIREAQDSAMNAASRAMACDPGDPDVQSAAALAAYRFRYDRAGALRLQRSAVANRPTDARFRATLGELLILTGLTDDGLRQMDTAIRLDSANAALHSQMAWGQYMARRYDDAIHTAERALVIDPSNAEAQEYIGWALFQTGRPREAVMRLQRATSLSGGNQLVRATLGYAYARAGLPDSARSVLRLLEQEVQMRRASPYLLAWVQTGLGDTAAALTSLERAWDERSAMLNYLDLNPTWAPLRGAPRFEAVYFEGTDTVGHLFMPQDERLRAHCERVWMRIIREEGLEFVYLGNVQEPGSEDTTCPECGRTVVGRRGYQVTEQHVREGACARCGRDVNITA